MRWLIVAILLMGVANLALRETYAIPATPAECADMTFDNIVVGTSGADTLYGTLGRDLIFGLGGADRIDGVPQGHTGPGDMADCLVGAGGNDRIFGNHGEDVLLGDEGNDSLYGGYDSDDIYGGPGIEDQVDCGTDANGLDYDHARRAEGHHPAKDYVNGGNSAAYSCEHYHWWDLV